jgi:hypothetical protein
MSENRFLKKYKTRTDSELERIISDKEGYVEDARVAALELLKERNGQTELIDKAEIEINLIKEKRTTIIEKRIENEKETFETNDPSHPELYSKRVITIFSILFSTIFGAILMMNNFKETGNSKARNLVLIFGILYTILSIAIINILNMPSNLAMILNFLGSGILTEYFWNKHIGKEVKYRTRSWIKPAIVSVIITIPILISMFYGQ